MGLYRRAPAIAGTDRYSLMSRHNELLINELGHLRRRISMLEDGRSVRPTPWIYVGTYPNDTYLAATPWNKFLTPDSPPWQNGGFPLDPAGSPVRFRVLVGRDITPDLEGGIDGPLNLTLFTMPAGYFRTDVGYTRHIIPALDNAYSIIEISNLGEVMKIA